MLDRFKNAILGTEAAFKYCAEEHTVSILDSIWRKIEPKRAFPSCAEPRISGSMLYLVGGMHLSRVPMSFRSIAEVYCSPDTRRTPPRVFPYNALRISPATPQAHALEATCPPRGPLLLVFKADSLASTMRTSVTLTWIANELNRSRSEPQKWMSLIPPTPNVQYDEPDLSWVDILLEEEENVAGETAYAAGRDRK